MTHDDSAFSNWLPATLPAAIVVSAIIVAYAFGPNCAPKPITIVHEHAAPPTEPEIDTSVEVPPPQDLGSPSCQQWPHTRLDDCKAQKGEFIRCLWWVYGGDHPDDYNLEPHRWDGANGYGAALRSE